jgi:hypothetical protein
MIADRFRIVGVGLPHPCAFSDQTLELGIPNPCSLVTSPLPHIEPRGELTHTLCQHRMLKSACVYVVGLQAQAE